MKTLLESGRDVVVLDETWLYTNITVKKCWRSDEVFGIAKNYSAGNRLILVYAGSKNEFVKSTILLLPSGIPGNTDERET